MLDYRILIGSRNRLDDALLSGGAYTAGLPLANLKTRELSQVARSINTAPSSTTFTLDFGQPRPIRLIALINHNCGLAALARYELSESPTFATRFYDETVEVWTGLLTAPWDIDALEWEDDNYWLGGFDGEDVAGLTATSTHVLPELKIGRYLRVTILDQNNPDGFVQLGRVFAGPVVSPRVNRSWGDALGYEFATAIEQALSGAEFFDPYEGVRVFRFTLQHLQADEAYGTFLQMVRERGVHGEVFVVPDPTDGFNGLQRNFLGRLRQPGPLETVQWENEGPGHAMAFEIKELR